MKKSDIEKEINNIINKYPIFRKSNMEELWALSTDYLLHNKHCEYNAAIKLIKLHKQRSPGENIEC